MMEYANFVRHVFILLISVLLIASLAKADLESSNIVGYQTNDIEPGVTNLEVSFMDVETFNRNSKNLVLGTLLPQNKDDEGRYGVIEDDELYIYNKKTQEMILEAIVVRKKGKLCIIDKKHRKNIDELEIPVTKDFENKSCSVKILINRKQKIKTEVRICGQAVLCTNPVNAVEDMAERDFVEWMRNEIHGQMENTMFTGVNRNLDFSYVFEDVLSCPGYLPIKFFYETKDGVVKEGIFDPVYGKFMDICGVEMRLSSTYVRSFKPMLRQYDKKGISLAECLPKKVVDKLNMLLNSGFFDSKQYVCVKLEGGEKRLAYWDEKNKVILDVKTGVDFVKNNTNVLGLECATDYDLKAKNIKFGTCLSKEMVLCLDGVFFLKKNKLLEWMAFFGDFFSGIMLWALAMIGQVLPMAFRKFREKLQIKLSEKSYDEKVLWFFLFITGIRILFLIYGACKNLIRKTKDSKR